MNDRQLMKRGAEVFFLLQQKYGAATNERVTTRNFERYVQEYVEDDHDLSSAVPLVLADTLADLGVERNSELRLAQLLLAGKKDVKSLPTGRWAAQENMMSNFWDEMQGAFHNSSVDEYLGGKRTSSQVTLRDLTDKGRAARATDLPKEAGTRVSFIENIGSLLTYDDTPEPGVQGTIVTVRTAMGDATNLDGNVFVLWDDGKLRGIRAEHLRVAPASKQASNVRMRVADMMSISDFFTASTTSSDELVHKATKDLWALKQDGDSFVIERLFNEDGNPLKV